MAFEYKEYAVDQFAGDLHDVLARNHPLAVVQVAEMHRLILSDSYPGGFDDVVSKDGMLAEGNISDALMFTTRMAHRDHPDISRKLLGTVEASNVNNLRTISYWGNLLFNYATC